MYRYPELWTGSYDCVDAVSNGHAAGGFSFGVETSLRLKTSNCKYFSEIVKLAVGNGFVIT